MIRRICGWDVADATLPLVLDSSCVCRDAAPGEERIVLVTFEVDVTWLAQFMVHAEQIDADAPRTFSNMRFERGGAGRRVGPWPGWRGIPVMQLPVLRVDERDVAGQPQLHGDESACGVLRAAYRICVSDDVRVVLEGGDEALRVRRIEVLAGCVQPPQPVALELRADLRGRHPRLFERSVDALVHPAPTEHSSMAAGRRPSTGDRVDALVHPAPTEHSSMAARRRPSIGERVTVLVHPAPTEHSSMAAGRRPSTGDRVTALVHPTPTEHSSMAAGRRPSTGDRVPARLEDRVLITAFEALSTPDDPATVRLALDTFAEACSLREHPDEAPLSIDTQCGEFLFVLCLAFDWLHASMSDEEHTAAHEALADIARITRRHLDPARRDYAQAHWLGAGLGLLAWTLVIDVDSNDTRAWRAELHGAYRQIVTMLPDDGFFPHGINLWIYEYGFHFRWLELLRHCCGVDLWHVTPHWRAAARFRIASTSHDLLHGVTFGDPQFRIGGDAWLFDLTARRTGDAQLSAFADAIRDLPVDGVDFRHAPPRRRVYESLWRDTSPYAFAFTDGIERFDDGGHVCIRRGALLIVARSGPPIGRTRRAAGEWGGYGHADPCNGGFLVWWRDRFVVAGPGPVYRRDTSLQNLLTIDDRGQTGDGCVWLPDVFPDESIPEAPVLTEDATGITLTFDLTRAYLAHLGVQRCTRRLHIAHDNVITGRDHITLSREGCIAWRLHTRMPVDLRDADAGRCVLQVDDRPCGIALTASAGTDTPTSAPVAVTLTAEATAYIPAYPHDGKADTAIVARITARSVRFDWSLELPGDAEETRT